MTGPHDTALFLGREREVALARSALEATAHGSPHTVLIGGDAGIGKTTLVTHLARSAADLGFAVAVGHCLDLEASVSFAPVVEAVRSLLSGAEDLDSRPSARRMRMVLDPGAPHGPESFHVLEDLRQTVLEAAATRPLMLVLEDMHWTDRSTQDFVVTLSRTARGPLALVLTFRNDDLHRRHPFRAALAEINRAPSTARLELGALDRDSIEAIVAARAGRADPSLVEGVLARSEGNPLYAEELAEAAQHGMPELLADLFLARMYALSEDARSLLRVASVGGTRLDTATLLPLSGLAPDRFDTLLREALDARVLRHAGDSLEFRHGLLREAVYDDLMPDERSRIHAELATILQARLDAEPEPGLAELSRAAFHWYAAHDLPHALVASVRAGTAAARLGAAEEVTHRERALTLWDRVPDAERVAGVRQIELVVLLAESLCAQGDGDRWYATARRAVDMVDSRTDPLLASRAYSALAFTCLFHTDSIGAEEAVRRALHHAGDSPSEELARALIASAALRMFRDDFVAALDDAERAGAVAAQVARQEVRIDALGWRAQALFAWGRMRESLAQREEVVAADRRAGLTGHALYAVEELARAYVAAGQVDRGVTLASDAMAEGLSLGLTQQAAACGDATVEVLVMLGRLEAAEQRLVALRALGLPDDRERRLHAQLLLAHGDVGGAAPVVRAEIVAEESIEGHPDSEQVLRVIELAAMLDDDEGARDVALSYLLALDACVSPLHAAAAARIGFQALALNRTSTGPAIDELRRLADRLLELARTGVTEEWSATYYGVQLALAEAYAARVASEPAVDRWREAVALADPFGAYFGLTPRLELARELLATDGRDEGRELLVDCWRTAHDMGAHELERQAFRLATRARVPLPDASTDEGPLSRLTPREREVLDLLATGATNKTIAGTLFISEKTVSVHVSNVLGKLGVENRGAAAALARRLVG